MKLMTYDLTKKDNDNIMESIPNFCDVFLLVLYLGQRRDERNLSETGFRRVGWLG